MFIMKIAISGTQGTGKSTMVLELASYYKKKFKNKKIHIIQENVINCPLSFNEKTSFKSQMWIISSTIKAEIEAETKYDIIVCDRSVFDPIAYLMACEMPHVSSIFYDFLKHYGRTYDKIYLMDGNNNTFVFDNGFRNTDEKFRTKVDECFKEIFNKLNDDNYLNSLEII